MTYDEDNKRSHELWLKQGELLKKYPPIHPGETPYERLARAELAEQPKS